MARAERVEGADDGDGGLEGVVVGQGDVVGGDLGGAVRGLGLERVGLVDGCVLGGAVDLGGGGVDDLGDRVPVGGGDDVVRAGHVGVDVGLGGAVGVGNRDEGGEVEDGVAPGDGVLHSTRVADIGEDDFEVVGWG